MKTKKKLVIIFLAATIMCIMVLGLALKTRNPLLCSMLVRCKLLDRDQVIDLLMENIRSGGKSEKNQALAVLKDMGREARSVVPELTSLLKKREEGFFSRTFEALDQIDPGWLLTDPGLVPFFIEIQTDTGSHDCYFAVMALKRLKPYPGQVIPEKYVEKLLFMLCSEDSHSMAAVQTLNSFVPGWAETERGRNAVRKLAESPVYGSARRIELWLDLVNEIGVRTDEVMARLFEMLADDRIPCLERIISVLNRLCPGWSSLDAAQEKIPAIVQNEIIIVHGSGKFLDILDRNFPDWRHSVYAKKAISRSLDFLTHGNEGIRERAEKLFDRIDPNWTDLPENIDRLKVFVNGLKKKAISERFAAINVLGRFGKHSMPYITELIKAFLYTQDTIPDLAEQALNRISPDWRDLRYSLEGILFLCYSMKKSDFLSCIRAIEGLGRIGPAAYMAIPLIRKMSESGNMDIKRQSTSAIQKIIHGQSEKDVEAKSRRFLVEALGGSSEQAGMTACYIVGETAPLFKDLVPQLTGLLGASSESLVREAICATGKFGPDAETALPALQELIRKKDPRFLIEAVRAVERIGSGTKSVLDDLELLAEHPDAEVREIVRFAIDQLKRR